MNKYKSKAVTKNKRFILSTHFLFVAALAFSIFGITSFAHSWGIEDQTLKTNPKAQGWVRLSTFEMQEQTTLAIGVEGQELVAQEDANFT